MFMPTIYRTLSAVALSLSLLLTAGCSDDNDESTEETVALDAAGIYDGTLATSTGDLVLMRLVLGRGGQTSINLQTTDRERPDIVLWGNSDGSADELNFSGTDTSSGNPVSLGLIVGSASVNGTLQLATLSGDFQLQRVKNSDLSSSLAALAGQYGRSDANNEVTELKINASGAVTVGGACQGTGSVASIDTQLNTYKLITETPCLSIDVLLTREQISDPGDVLSLSGISGAEGYAADFYRQ